jgi:hypothetical protein
MAPCGHATVPPSQHLLHLFASDFRFCYGRYVGLPPLPHGITVVAGSQAQGPSWTF